MNRTEHLEAIVAKCRANLALAEKRTQGEYEFVMVEECTIKPHVVAHRENGHRYTIATPVHSNPETERNMAFIAACAGSAEAGWRSTIAAIEGAQRVIACHEAARYEGLNERLAEIEHYPGNLRDLVERRLSWGEAEAICQLDAIIAAWPVELLGVGE